MEAMVHQSHERVLTRNAASRRNNSAVMGQDMMVQLHELLEGERSIVRIYSKALGEEICFVNPEVEETAAEAEGKPVYTTRELAFIMSLSAAELQRYHYLKTRLV